MAKLKLHKEVVKKAIELANQFKIHWDRQFKDIFQSYRFMGAGQLPQEWANTLKSSTYKRRSKLIPRMIPDAKADLKAYLIHNTFHRKDPFEFVGRGDEDADRAGRNNDLVKYAWDVTDVEITAGEILDDTLDLGAGIGEITYFEEKHFVPNQGYQTFYRGGKLNRVRNELFYPEPVRQFKNITACAKIMVVPVSSIRKKAHGKGVYAEYAPNVKKIKELSFKNPEEEYDTSKDHADGQEYKTLDFPVQLAEIWMHMTDDKKLPETWYCITLANYGSSEPLLIRYQRDPMQTSKHPFLWVQIFPRNDRMYGDSVPEMLRDLFLEKFHKRNQRIDLINWIVSVQGSLVGKQGGISKDSIYFKMHKYIGLKSGNPKDLTNINLDTSGVQATLQEEMVIEKDADQTMATNRISSGRDPSRRETATTNTIIDENAKVRQTNPIRNVENSFIKPVAKGYLVLLQLFMPQKMQLRILGSKGFVYSEIERKDIQGFYDVKCRASTEILSRALKQANFNAMIQTYMNNPQLKLNWVELFVDHAELNEIPNGKKYVIDPEREQANIEREHEIMDAGFPYPVSPYDLHEQHLNAHTKRAFEIYQQIRQSGESSELTASLIVYEDHVKEHLEQLKIQQGQTNFGGQSQGFKNLGEYLDDTRSVTAPKVAGV